MFFQGVFYGNQFHHIHRNTSPLKCVAHKIQTAAKMSEFGQILWAADLQELRFDWLWLQFCHRHFYRKKWQEIVTQYSIQSYPCGGED